MTYTFKPRSRKNLIEQANARAISTRIKQMATLEEKQQLVVETNPFLHIFGKQRLAQGHLDYSTWLDRIYIGRRK